VKAKDIKYIVIHCTAGFGELSSIKSYWKDVLGWRGYGYHRIVRVNGKTHKLKPFDRVVNGVKGFNDKSINISYIGGVDSKNYKKAIDTRNGFQKDSLIKNIKEALEWLYVNGNDLSDVRILGHRDLSSHDLNGNGVIDSNERSKECPSFDAIDEYKNIIETFLENKRITNIKE